MGLEPFDVVRFDFEPLLQGQMRITKLKSAYNSLIIYPRGLQCETKLYEIICWESFDVVRFDLGPLFQVKRLYQNLKSAYDSLIISLRGLQCETTS